MSATALEGVRVIDLTHGPFGYAGKLLAGFGASVLKVEPPDGDPVRHEPPFAHDRPDPNGSLRHLHFNTGKQATCLDLDVEEGRDALRALVAEADVVLESFEPGYLRERGLDYDTLAQASPGLVMASVTHFGQDGPYADYRGSEIAATALGGYLMLTGDPDREPVKAYDDLVQQQAATQAAVAVMVGLTARDATGAGDYFDVSCQEAALFLMGGPAQSYHESGRVVRRRGARLLFDSPRVFYPSTIRPCKDGYVHAHTNVRNPDLMAVLTGDERFNDPEVMAEPLGNADLLDEWLDEWLAGYDKFEVVRRAQEIRLPFTEVLTPQEVVMDPHLSERGYFVEVDAGEPAGRMLQPGAPGRLSDTPWQPAPAPRYPAAAPGEAVPGEEVSP